jgi:NAD(P)-dependent dehydrogenase (short-subunit alcohol dehydrogenase family)
MPEGIALVTGAGRGLGRAVALELARRGFEVLATARRPEALAGLPAEAPAGRLRVAALDVTRPDALCLPEGLRVLVNNAGIEPEYLPVEHTPLDVWREIFETNLFGLVELTRRAIPVLRAAGGGVVCNVTSSACLAPVPFYAAYRASKAAVSALGESLRAELAPFGIRLLEILPGPIAADMLARSDRVPEAARWPEYRAMAERSLAGRRQAAAMTTAAADAARAIADAIFDPGAPLRVGCDPLARGLLEGWRAQGDEAFQRAMLPAFVGKG